MKKIFLAAAILVLLTISCKKQPELTYREPENELERLPPVCGMEDAMASLSDEMKQAMLKSTVTTESQATELLVFLDFDGAVVRPGFGSAQGGNVTTPLVNSVRICPPPTLTMEQKDAIIELVKDDFSPFKIQFTTEQAVYDAYLTGNKQVCIITTFPSVLGMGSGVAGVSPFIGLGSRLPNNPCFVFANVYGGVLGEIASTISHEAAHTMGLGHQSSYNNDCGFIFDYSLGFGTGPLSFAPIMGLGGKRISNWYAQSCIHPVYGGPQNDFVFLNNQVALKNDDFSNDPEGGTISAAEINGILEQDGDVDFIQINFKNPGPVTISSENIDIQASVYNNGGHLLSTYNDPNDTGVTIPSVNGKRFLKIEAVSNANMSSQFMTGQYKIIY